MQDGTFGLKEKPRGRKQSVNEFQPIDEAGEHEDDYSDEVEVARFKKPVSGRSSRSCKGKTNEGVHKSLSNQDDLVTTGDRSYVSNSRKALRSP